MTRFREFDPVKFTKWINVKFIEFCAGNVRVKITDFAKFLENRSQTVSYWLLGKLTERPSDDQCKNLIMKYGYEAYDPLGLEPPLESEISALLPKVEAEAIISALSEIRELGLYNGNASTSPEHDRMIREVFAKYNVKVETQSK